MYGTGIGRLVNPGKNFFLKLAADSIRDVNSHLNKAFQPYARRAMIIKGLYFGVYGAWSETHLIVYLQTIVSQYRNFFYGEPVSSADVETESDEDSLQSNRDFDTL